MIREPGQTFHIELQALPGDVFARPPEYRLRGLLKAALRLFGFRCISVVETKPTDKK